jgi:putative sporulation protein YtaF
MDLFYVILLGIAVSIDGFVAGLAYGLKNIRMPFISLSIVGLVTCLCASIALFCAYFLGKFIPTNTAIGIGAALLILLGLWSIFQQYLSKDPSLSPEDPQPSNKITFSLGRLIISIMARPEIADLDKLGIISPWEAVFLGLALAVDAMVGIFGAALMGSLPFYTPFAIGVIHMLCVASGCYSSTHLVSQKVKKRFPYLPGTLLILLGIIRLG